MRGPPTVSTHITPDTIAYLAGEGTPDQQQAFQAGADLINEVYASRYPDAPEDLEAMAADQYVGAAMYALGDTTLKAAGEALQEARRAYMEASDHLAGAMCVAREQGMTVSQVADAAGVTRSIVYKRTEPAL